MATPATQPTVTVYFDFICPFCYLGGLRLRRLQQRWGFDLAWEGIQIHPETPRTGAPIARFGDELLRRAASGIVALAEEEGVEINLPLTLANSGLAHRMAELARREGCLDAYLERTFHAYFQEGRDLGDNQTVPAIVRALGIPRPAIGRFLDDRDGFARLITARLQAVAAMGFRGFPAVVMGEQAWQGVQPVAVWEAGLATLGARRI
ncbi:MAG: hypothetical protein COW73_00775 [Nitrospirae bacterium CG18_big_fil_WC_8_21_14_2_50_70_55]|nr:hypothetical protein [Deltaproteobacteria bacterium]OIP62513.1 MAG: hypothetical protein AUK30_10105 [Nitrospirae bacterium CG2_30_70_394]PIQ07055.1 MAG: hypothetical protein COW73_00775 [Nitrospirae bacterium CG18_big_fil_WC_8_21_14_2_50_70_55]PIU78890.1 MAG: hypothetical protein COS73_05940 [Nitrospirae bacterium CG06_land_8_20_14_3_00_70_43]PIW82360.1 MAG: hypothetical protein COZ96_09010 [Nitrospirae bacterium CG_4_8_14_3_um_filter_70_85]PIX82370.1 MAG: hypothetical protein COZ33_10855 